MSRRAPFSLLRHLRTLPLTAGLCAFFLCGCTNYQLGTHASVPFTTITIQPVVNDTFAPQAQALLHQQLADSLAQEKNLQVLGSDGQATLIVRIARYEKHITATRSDDTVLGSSYQIEMTAECTLLDNRTGKPYFQSRPIYVSADSYASSGYTSSEYQTMPILTRELARKIKEAVVSTW